MGPGTLIGAALGAAALSIGAAVALGAPPVAAASGTEVVAWLRANQDGVRWAVWCLTLTVPLLAIVFAMLRGLLPAPHRDVFAIGAIAIIVLTTAQTWIWAGLALHADRLEPATARTVLDVALFFGPTLTGATTTMMLPVTIVALRGETGFPKWLGLVGIVVIAEQLVETITIFGTSGFTEPGGAMNMQLGAAMFTIWLLAFALWGAAAERTRTA